MYNASAMQVNEAGMTLYELITKARTGDVAAFSELTRRYRNLAFATALSLLRDFHLAEDATQEAFLAAYHSLDRLELPEAFPGWLRGIVRHQCYRILRKPRPDSLPLDAVTEIAGTGETPADKVERTETRHRVLDAIASLPIGQREVTTLFYLREFSQRQIAQLLGVPVSTVNNRLHEARQLLKGEMLAMVKDVLKDRALGEDFSKRIGKVLKVKGPVIEVQFSSDDVPAVLSTLTSAAEPTKIDLAVQVTQKLGDGVVRCITTSAAGGLKPGMSLHETLKPAGESFANSAAERVVRALSPSRTFRTEASEILETGIKVIDLLCPFVRGGRVGLFGPMGAGKLVLAEELVRRIASDAGGISLFTFVHASDSATVQQCYAKEPQYTGSGAGAVQNFFIPSESATDPDPGRSLAYLDTIIYLSSKVANKRIYPAIDPLRSVSKHLDPSITGEERWETAIRVRDLLQEAGRLHASPSKLDSLSDAGRILLARAEKIERFFSQPFFVAEPYTHTHGRSVSAADTVAACREILGGTHDSLPLAAFDFTGGIVEVMQRASDLNPRQ